jgi:hypothetical protein
MLLLNEDRGLLGTSGSRYAGRTWQAFLSALLRALSVAAA